MPSIDGMAAVLRSLRSIHDVGGRRPADVFERLPDRSALPDYYKVITSPMCLIDVDANIEAGSYATARDFVRDLQRIFRNARIYNPRNSVFVRDANRLQAQMEDAMRAFPVGGTVDNSGSDDDGSRSSHGSAGASSHGATGCGVVDPSKEHLASCQVCRAATPSPRQSHEPKASPPQGGGSAHGGGQSGALESQSGFLSFEAASVRRRQRRQRS